LGTNRASTTFSQRDTLAANLHIDDGQDFTAATPIDPFSATCDAGEQLATLDRREPKFYTRVGE